MLIMTPEVFSESYPHFTIKATLFRMQTNYSIKNDKHAGMMIFDAAPSSYRGDVSLQQGHFLGRVEGRQL